MGNNEFVEALLDNACPATSHVVVLNDRAVFMKSFYIETHCIGWWVDAWKDVTDKWHIVSVKSEAV